MIPLDNGSAGRSVYLSNLQRQDYFDGFFRYHESNQGECSGFSSFDGLMTTGLHVGLSTGLTLDDRYDELPADNTLQITAQDSSVYFGDLYGPLTSQQITPWTRPNINGWTFYPDPFSPSWKAVDNIRKSGTSMIFDFKSDFRISPVIRDSSWMGAETENESITGVVTIASGGVLTLTDNVVLPDVHILSDGKLIVESTAHPEITGTLTVDTDGVLRVKPGGSLTNGTQTYLGTSFVVSKDTYLDEYGVGPYGSYPDLYAWGISGGQAPAGPDPPGPSRRVGLMQWDVSAIPVGSVAQNAHFILDVTNETSSPGYDFFEVLRDWNESQATWTNASTGNPWQSPGAGGSLDRDLVDPMGNAIPSSTGTQDFDLGTHGAEVVTKWIQSSGANHGVAVARTLNSDALEWNSKDQPTANPKPTLEVTYTVGRQVDVKVFLEDSYYNGQMSTTLNQHGDVPLTQPYDMDPWYYAGDDSVSAMPPDAVDWVLVHLLTDASQPQIVATKAGLLDKYGNVSVLFSGVSSGLYRLAVDHRNHVGVMSSVNIDLTGPNAAYDFTVPGAAETEGSGPPMRDVNGVRVMFAADGSADGQVTALDFILWLAKTTAGATGYQAADYNMDRQVTALDFTRWLPNTTAGAATPGKLACALYGLCPGGQAEALAVAEAYVRLYIRKASGHDFWVDVQIKRDPSLGLVNLGSADVDMYYNDADLTYSSSVLGDLDGLNSATRFFDDDPPDGLAMPQWVDPSARASLSQSASHATAQSTPPLRFAQATSGRLSEGGRLQHRIRNTSELVSGPA